jgi:hypothetical protein
MPRPRIPTYRRYKPKNLGLVVIDGKQHYLGKYGTSDLSFGPSRHRSQPVEQGLDVFRRG